MKLRLAALAAVSTLAVFASSAWSAPAPAPAPKRDKRAGERMGEIREAIHSLRLEEAEALLSGLPPKLAATSPALVEQARYRFFRGQYREAVELMDRVLSLEGDGVKQGWLSLRGLYASTDEVTRNFEQLRTTDGRYVVSFPKGKEALMAPYALQVLEAADRALSAAFGVSLPPPVRLEIYPSAETLSVVSPLTVEQIQTTGTVALSKWNRLMITSPRALVRGYPWADTIGHELVHLVLSRVTGEQAPVWLQEGTAKLFERAWRGADAGLLLEPSSLALLDEAARADELITFEEMHPSIAMLPSDEDASLAFAQVATFMERYVAEHGADALRAALKQIRDDVDAQAALAAAAGTSFAELEKGWRATLVGKGENTSKRRLKLRFRMSSDRPDESSEVVETDARRFMRIGDLLWDRGRPGAAAREYEKAHAADPEDPIVAARWGRAALDAGDAASAERAMSPQAERFPNHAPTQAVLGSARLQLGKRGEAAESLREAIRINPFDPQPHCDLARASDDSVEVEREQRACAELGAR